MAPKRKRTDEAAGSTATRRSTRSSTRMNASANEAEGTWDTMSVTSDAGTAMMEEVQAPPAKRGKKAAPRTASTKTHKAQLATSNTPVKEVVDKPPAKSSLLASKSYSPQRAEELFKIYADPDDPSVIGPEGFERLCADASLPLEGALPLILAWQFGAKEMAKISKSEWNSTVDLRISNVEVLSQALHELEDLLLLGKPSVLASAAQGRKGGAPSAQVGPYDRTRYYRYSMDKTRAFTELYAYCFTLAKPPQARNIDMETAAAFWTVLVVPQYPIMADVLEFINEKGSYKGVNKDLWTMVMHLFYSLIHVARLVQMLEFCRTVKPDLSNYDSDGAWPTLLDDFVAWKNAKDGKGNTSQEPETSHE